MKYLARQTFSLSLPLETISRLYAWMDQRGVTNRSQAVTQLLEGALDAQGIAAGPIRMTRPDQVPAEPGEI